jgi:hypothetical protein
VVGEVVIGLAKTIYQPALAIASLFTTAALVLVPAFGELDAAPHGADVAAKFPLAPLVLRDVQLFQLTLNSLALVGPQPTTGGFMAACRDVTVNKLTVDPMRGSEFSTQFVCQPTECDRAKAERLGECHAVS